MEEEKIYILGGGTLGQFIIDIAQSIGVTIDGVFDDAYGVKNEIMGVKLVGKFKDVEKFSPARLVIGVGEPKYRKDLYDKYKKLGWDFPSMIHQSVVVSSFACIEEGVIIGPNSSVLSGSIVKSGSCLLSHVNVNQNVKIDEHCLIGAGVVIGNNANLETGCHLGLGVSVGLGETAEAWEYKTQG